MTADIRYIAIAIIFLVSLLGVLVALRCRSRSVEPFVKMFVGGVIMSLALVHITTEASSDIENVVEFPVVSACVIGGILSMFFVENLSLSWQHKSYTDNDGSEPSLPVSYIPTHYQGRHDDHIDSAELQEERHEHTCVSSPKPANKNMTAYVFETACLFHSFLIGFALGISDATSKEARTLFITLCFHQLMEGVSVGYIITASHLSTWKATSMAFLFTAITPIGVGVGISVETSGHTDNSSTWITVRSCALGVSAGMLLYIAMVQMILEECSKKELHNVDNFYRKIRMYLCLLVGASSMTALALWI